MGSFQSIKKEYFVTFATFKVVKNSRVFSVCSSNSFLPENLNRRSVP